MKVVYIKCSWSGQLSQGFLMLNRLCFCHKRFFYVYFSLYITKAMADTKKIIVVQLSSNISSSPLLILIKIRESQPLTPTALFLYHNF